MSRVRISSTAPTAGTIWFRFFFLLHQYEPTRILPGGFCLCSIILRIAELNDVVDVLIALEYEGIILPMVWEGTVPAVLYAILGVGTAAAAFSAQRIERAKAEQAVEFLLRHIRMTGEVFAGTVLKEAVMPCFLHE